MTTTPNHSVIQSMYEAINRRDIPAAMDLIDDDCIYEDLNFSQPFLGKDAVRELFEESCQGIPDDLRFVIDELTQGEQNAFGVLWHVELDGIPFPNGRGVSFYRLSEKTGKLVFARDLVEPPIKPGKVSFWLIRLVTPLVRLLLKQKKDNRGGTISVSDRGNRKSQPLLSVLLGGMAVAYIYILLLSPPGQIVPGEPVWAIKPETIQEIIDESLNFFLILPLLNLSGIHYLAAPIVHPWLEGLFNFAEAWIFMFLPLLLADKRTSNLPKVPIWCMAMFLTNAILIPYMALRYSFPAPQDKDKVQKDWLGIIFGWIGLTVGIIALLWGFIGRPEFGDLAQRAQYFGAQITTNRVTLAFCVDLVFFGIFQAVLLEAIIPEDKRMRWLRFIPFWGLAAWLIKK